MYMKSIVLQKQQKEGKDVQLMVMAGHIERLRKPNLTYGLFREFLASVTT